MSETFAPVFRITIDGEVLQLSIAQKVASLTYEDTEEEDDEMTLVIEDPYGHLVDHPSLEAGKEIGIQWGHLSESGSPIWGPERIGLLMEPEVSYQDVVRITLKARDKGSKLHGVVSQRIWQNVSHSDIVKEIAQAHGLQADVEETGTVIESEPQANRSDYDFIAFLATENEFQFYVEDEKLFFGKRKLDEAPIRTIMYFRDRLNTLIEFTPQNNEQENKGKSAQTSAVGYDMEEREAIRHDANEETSDEPRLAPQTYIVDAETGRITPEGSETGHVTATPHETEEEVEKEAEHERQEATIKQMTATLTVLSDPRLRSKKVVRLVGFSNRFDGNWAITKARHVIDGSGGRVELELARDGSGAEETKTEPGSRPANDQEAEPDRDEVTQYVIDAETMTAVGATD